jgi:hypothetical protein
MEINKLTDKQVRHALPVNGKPVLLSDGMGLYLQITPSKDPANPARSWLFIYKTAGKPNKIGLGSLATVSLADAREKAKAQRALIDAGKDPKAERERIKTTCLPDHRKLVDY